uniref:Uncharacterized protein n=1 Tax=Lactuca sativa TaxID=4236 RepID=A0A9R1UUT1_LACSA|nr:hypothetical protein LSAT_V11C800415670 [Lactuca sativa]
MTWCLSNLIGPWSDGQKTKRTMTLSYKRLMGRMEDDSDDEAVFFGEDLTWRYIAHASGAYEPSYRNRASRVQTDGIGTLGVNKGKTNVQPSHMI